MPARRAKFVANNHREHRAKRGRDFRYRYNRVSRLKKKFLIEKDEDNKHIYNPNIK